MRKILAVALDAAEPSLIEKWMEDGSLPVMKKLRGQGMYGRLSSPADWLTGSSWPTFYTGVNPANHGFYNYLVWNAEKMDTEIPNWERMPLRPFWRNLKNPAAPRLVVVDVPLTYAPEPFNGREIISFATHDTLVPFSGYPQEFVDLIRTRYGAELVSNERYDLLSKKDFIQTRDEMIRVAQQVGELCADLIRQGDWDFFLASFACIHRAGHRLWGLNNIKEPLTPSEGAEFSDALRQIYIACDQELGKLMEAAGPDTIFLVFSLHGMRYNTSRNIILPEMLRRVLLDEYMEKSAPSVGLLSCIRDLIPSGIRHRVKSMLPVNIRHRLTSFWRRNPNSWDKTPAFSMMADAQGWIRINLKGREKLGTVHPGREYDELCEKIATGLRTYVDADTNQPIVKNIVRASQVFEGEKLDMLPDLIIQWEETPVHELRAAVSPLYGEILWPMPGRNPEGRSGNHFPQGMLIAAGDGVKSGNIKNGHTLDLAPTILNLLGQPVPPEMEGKVLPIIKTEG